jgi:two-component system, LytTR family, response regulator
MYPVKCIIIEDEPLAAKVLADYIGQVPFLQLQASFKDALLASDYLRQHGVDLIFLDIHLPRLKGMAFLKTLTHPPAVIITTAYHQYAVEGFELNVTDYLLKPFEFERFLLAVNKLKKRAVVPVTEGAVEQKDYLFLNIQKKKVKILFADILYVESQREYVKVVTSQQEYLSKIGTQDIEALLPQQGFRRIHRSFIIAVSKIRSFTAEMVELPGMQIPIGRAYRGVLDDL